MYFSCGADGTARRQFAWILSLDRVRNYMVQQDQRPETSPGKWKEKGQSPEAARQSCALHWQSCAALSGLCSKPLSNPGLRSCLACLGLACHGRLARKVTPLALPPIGKSKFRMGSNTNGRIRSGSITAGPSLACQSCWPRRTASPSNARGGRSRVRPDSRAGFPRAGRSRG